MSSASDRQWLLETILDKLQVALTYVDEQGIIVYLNKCASDRASDVPRVAGTNIADCHKDTTNKEIARMFAEFREGRREPHYYVGGRLGKKELVTIIPVFEQETFVGCFSQIHPLEVEGPERSF